MQDKTDWLSLFFGLYGVVILVVAAFFPRGLAFIPGNRWFWPYGPPASRLGSTVGGLACIGVAYVAFADVSDQTMSSLLPLVAGVVIAVFVYDLSKAFTDEPPLPPTRRKPQPSRGTKRKRRRRRG